MLPSSSHMNPEPVPILLSGIPNTSLEYKLIWTTDFVELVNISLYLFSNSIDKFSSILTSVSSGGSHWVLSHDNKKRDNKDVINIKSFLVII